MKEIAVQALADLLAAYSTTESSVSQAFYQGLCARSLDAIKQLQTENKRLSTALQEKGEYGYSQEVVDALEAENKRLQAKVNKADMALAITLFKMSDKPIGIIVLPNGGVYVLDGKTMLEAKQALKETGE